MGHLDELRTMFKEVLDEREPVRPVDRGLLGDGQGNLWVPADSDSRVWFRKKGYASQLVKVHCWNARAAYGVPVLCGYTTEQPTLYQVLSWDREALEGGWTGMSGVPRHAETHIWSDVLGGDDPVMVWTRALMPFRVSPQATPDYTVQVQGPEMYLWLTGWTQWLGDASVDLSASYPGAGLHRYSLVSIDGATSVAQVTDGGAILNTIPLAIGGGVVPPAGCIPLALIYLNGAAVAGNEIEEADLVDARGLVGASGGSITPAAHHLIDTTVHDDTDTYGVPVQGDVLRFDTDWERLAKGTAHQLFKMNAGATLPIWASFDWDEISAAAAADMVHDHSIAAEGGHIPLASLVDATRGDIIRRGAADWEAYPAETNHFILVGDGTDIISKAFDWDDMALGAGADMVHTHGSAAEGGTHWAGITQSFGGGSGANIITIPDGLAEGLIVRDGDPIEYWMLKTAAQLVSHFNRGEADVDHIFSSDTITNALRILGSTGAITIDGPSIDVLDDFWIGGGAAAGRLVFEFGTTPDRIQVEDADLAMRGNDIILDADADSYLHVAADDQIALVLATAAGQFDININGAVDFSFTANMLDVLAGSKITLTGGELEFTAASGSNLVEFPDNFANALYFADATTAINFQQFVTTTGAQATVFNIGEAAVGFRVAGLGTANAFAVDGLTSHVGFNNAPSASYLMVGAETFTATAGILVGEYLTITAAPATASTAYYYGLFPYIVYTGAGATTGGVIGNLAQVVVNTDANIARVGGQWISVSGSNTRISGVSEFSGMKLHVFDAEDLVVTNAYGLITRTASIDTGSIGGNFGIRIHQGVRGAGLMTVQYGIYMSAMTIANTNYAIYSAGGNSYHAGRFAVGGTVGALAQWHVDQSAVGGGIPVALFDQADLSEEFIEFTTTVGAGNPIDTAPLGAYYGKARVMVTGVGYKVLALYEES